MCRYESTGPNATIIMCMYSETHIVHFVTTHASKMYMCATTVVWRDKQRAFHRTKAFNISSRTTTNADSARRQLKRELVFVRSRKNVNNKHILKMLRSDFPAIT